MRGNGCVTVAAAATEDGPMHDDGCGRNRNDNTAKKKKKTTNDNNEILYENVIETDFDGG